MHRYTLKYNERLHKQKDFKNVLDFGRRLSHPAILIYIYKRKDGSEMRRLGLISSRKAGKAVARNRMKRLLREIFRLNKHSFTPGIDIIFILKKDGADLNYCQFEPIVISLLKRAGVYYENQESQVHTGKHGKS